MAGSTVAKPGAWMTSRFPYAAGVTGTLANFFPIASFTFRFSRLRGGTSFGPTNDVAGSLASAFMIPVVLT